MSPELTTELFNKYSIIFEGKNKSIRESLLPFGLECDDGWYVLLDTLCSRLAVLEPQPTVIQVKEKYGTLRFYISGTDEAFDLVDKAEAESATICETCGKEGKLCTTTGNAYGWFKTLCVEHAKEFDYKVLGTEPEE